jgi:hypothetical protein
MRIGGNGDRGVEVARTHADGEMKIPTEIAVVQDDLIEAAKGNAPGMNRVRAIEINLAQELPMVEVVTRNLAIPIDGKVGAARKPRRGHLLIMEMSPRGILLFPLLWTTTWRLERVTLAENNEKDQGLKINLATKSSWQIAWKNTVSS